MGVPKISTSSVLSLMAILAALFQVCCAQDSPQDYINAHNRARAQVGVGPLRWDESVASYARNYVNKLKDICMMKHSGGPYGENLAWSSGELTGTAAVNLWVAEKPHYDYNSNTCVGGECLHYTQVVWRNSIRLGCAKVRCNDGRSTIISCNYDPRGNYMDQRPYDISPFQIPLSFNKGLEEN